MTAVWEGDQQTVSWDAKLDGVPVDMSGAEVQLVMTPLTPGRPTVILPAAGSANGVLSVDLDGTLPVDEYNWVSTLTRGGQTVTWPSADIGPMRLKVRAKIG